MAQNMTALEFVVQNGFALNRLESATFEMNNKLTSLRYVFMPIIHVSTGYF